jgi:hypothetical protein
VSNIKSVEIFERNQRASAYVTDVFLPDIERQEVGKDAMAVATASPILFPSRLRSVSLVGVDIVFAPLTPI